MAAAAVGRLPQLGRVGLSSDEAVYIGQGLGLTGDTGWSAVRAHSPLFGLVLDLVPGATSSEVGARSVAVVFGLVAIVVAGLLGREIAGPFAGILAAVVLAVMPYHADVTRLALVDVPMATVLAIALLLVIRTASTGREVLLVWAGGVLGVATLFKETAVLSALALAIAVMDGYPSVSRRTAARALGSYGLVAALYPAYLLLVGRVDTAAAYLAWQFDRGSGNSARFYLEQVLPRIGIVVILLAGVGIVAGLRSRRLGVMPVALAAGMPIAFYALWPVEGYPYLLAETVPLAVLAGLGVLTTVRRVARWGWAASVPVTLVLAVLVVDPTHALVPSAPVLPGSSGVPGVREAAHWLSGRPETPVVTASPWVANIVRFYAPGTPIVPFAPGLADQRTNNPAYRDAVTAQIPTGSVLVMWDMWSAATNPSRTARLLSMVRVRGGRVAHVETDGTSGEPRVVVVVFLVEPATGQPPDGYVAASPTDDAGGPVVEEGAA